MAKYVLLYTGGGMAETEVQQAEVMQAWGAWLGKLGSALVDGGNPFSSAASYIASDGSVSQGAKGTPATGYTIIQADSLNSAVELARGCPQLQSNGQITVYEAIEM